MKYTENTQYRLMVMSGTYFSRNYKNDIWIDNSKYKRGEFITEISLGV